MIRLLKVFAKNIFEASQYMCLNSIKRNYLRECEGRPLLSDEEFITSYYSAIPFPDDIPLRVRRIFREQLRCGKVIPDDTVWKMSDDIPFEELMFDVAEEFEIEFSDAEIESLSGSFDSIVQLVASQLSME